MKQMKSVFLMFLVSCQFVCLTAEVILDPPVLVLNPADYPDGRFTAEVEVENRDNRSLSVSVMTGEDDWQLSPGELELVPGERAVLSLEGFLTGDVPAPLILLSDREDVPYLYSINLLEDSAALQTESPDKTEENFVFFYTPGCRICEEFYNQVIPDLMAEELLDSRPEKLNIYDPGNFERMNDLLSRREGRGDQFPLLIRGDLVFRGEKSLFNDFPATLKESQSMGNTPAEDQADLNSDKEEVDLNWIPVLLAGLLDGINPCAFTTLIFLISYLRLLGRKGREVLKIGFSFTLAVFISYFLIGLGLLQVVRMAESFSFIARIIRLGMIGFLFILGGMSLYDYIRVRQGQGNDAVLQLSRGMKRRIHKTIRQKSRSSWLILSSFAAGVLISLYELGCTGQIYLPMIVYMVKQEFSLSGMGLLVLYNAGFILPLLLIFLLFYKGMDSDSIGRIFKRNLSWIKLAGAVLFFGMALYLIITI